ncbi:MAG: gamma-glutamyltransferase [Ferrimicrobium sp.]|uniref:Gamma-glutamyltransferase n=1 Tax=Ferrimicrobium acidiphilum TaxID=121039 RepID=A0ABV3Y4T3_9ACTN|nr:gamma-glutamyltransferase [Ferrimicrobium sp.]
MSYFSPSFSQLFPKAAVSSIDPLASQAALDLIRHGGSAIDAAIAANAVLSVTAPDQCGLGGDLVALVFCPPSSRGPAQVRSLQAIGHSGTGASADILRSQGHGSIPRSSVQALTVPGAVDGWLALHQKFGRLRLDQVLDAAIDYATNGFPASTRLRRNFEQLRGFASAAPLGDFLGSTSVQPLVRRPGVGRTLAAIAKLGREGFYAGEFGAELMKLGEGVFRPDDLATPIARFSDPITSTIFGHTLSTNPAPSAGFLILGALAQVDTAPTEVGNADWYIALIEAFKKTAWMRAFHHDEIDLNAVLTNTIPAAAPRTQTVAAGPDTTAITAVDTNGLGVVLVQSNGHAFGSRLATPDTNIFIHDRGAVGFNLVPGDANELQPKKRPRHTLAPIIAQTPQGNLALLAGTMGGDRQPSILAQLVTGVLRDRLSPSDALVQPRFAFGSNSPSELSGFDTFDGIEEPIVTCEEHLIPSVLSELTRRLGAVKSTPAYGSDSGVAHLIIRHPSGWVTASDPRSEAVGVTGF